MTDHRSVFDSECWCSACDDDLREQGVIPPLEYRMNLCPDCGNKRCPKATFHGNKCTDSNDAGQEGSKY